jgi:HEPN domain-containing protein
MPDCFSSAAGRHLHDARILVDNQCWDNGVYLARYTVECVFKLLVEQYFPPHARAARKYGHDLTALSGKAIERLRVLYPILDSQLPASRLSGTVLATEHPDRRYAKSGRWTREEATGAIECAEAIYREVIPKLVLNGLVDRHDI